jgi:hypothetical protein
MSGVTATATSFNGSANIVIPITAVPATLLTGTIASARLSGSYPISVTSATSATTAGSATTATTATTTTGNAGSATVLQTARTINGVSFNGSANITVESYIEDDEATNAVRYITFVDDSTASFKRLNEDSSLTYNPSTNTLSAGIFAGTATTARYADLAEMYEADQPIEPGYVVCFGGTKEVEICDTDSCTRIAGVISTNPSYLMNSDCAGEHVVAVALTGRVPVRVKGVVRKGDMMVATGDGCARAEANPRMGSVIGKALADFDGDEGVIEVVVGRL